MAKQERKSSARKLRPALTPEARENQLISLAVDLTGQYLKKFYPRGGGHAIAWQVIDGDVKFIDGQGGFVYSNALDDIFKKYQRDTIEFVRLDNLKPKADVLKNYVTNRV